MTVLIFGNHDGDQLTPASRSAIACGLQLADRVDVLLMGSECQSVANETASLDGVARVLVAQAEHLSEPLAENMAPVIQGQASEYTWVLAAADSAGKNVMPRVAAALGVQQISDIVAVIDGETFVRPIYAGNALARVRTRDAQRVITVRSTAFAPVAPGDQIAPIEFIEAAGDSGLVEHHGYRLSGGDGPDLGSADIVVSGGRGVGSAENFALINRLAERLNAAVGASRAAVDAGYVPNDHQVGQTGRVVAPALYLAVGISGAIQHLAGMKESRVIAAINSDPEAPIFDIADYGLVQDLMSALEELEHTLAETPSPLGKSA